MSIGKNTVVSFHYRLSENNVEIESSFDGNPMLALIGHGRSEEHTSELQSPYVTSYAACCLESCTNTR